MSAETTGCLVCTKPRTADVGYLCHNHLERLAAMLRDVEDQAAMLTAVPSMQIRTGSGGGSLKSERAPARLDVLAFRDPQTKRWTRDEFARHPLPQPKAFGPWCLLCDHASCTDWRAGRRRDLHDDEHDAGSDRLMSVVGVLNGWARIVREERSLETPQRVVVTTERDTLSRHLGWLAAQPFIDEMYGEVKQLVASLKDLNGTADDKPAGRCYLPNETGICHGPIWLDTAMGHAHCGRCQQTWDGSQLAMLAFELERARAEAARPKTEDGRRMLTAQELADRLGTTVVNVRKMASRQQIRAVLGHYDPDRFTVAPRNFVQSA